MANHIGRVSVLVKDYDEAIRFYQNVFGFHLLEDEKRSESKRWVVMAPDKTIGASILLAKAKNEYQSSYIGNQTGGRVFLFLYVDSLEHFYQKITNHGVVIHRGPKTQDFGKVLVCEDLYGNLWDVIERN